MIPQPPPGRDPRVPPAVTPSSSPTPVHARTTTPARRAPRSRQELTSRQLDVTAADEAAFATLETELGGRPALLAVLAAADLTQDEGKILGLLADPENDRISLAKVCLGGGLRMSRLMKLFQAAALAKGQVKAIGRIAAKLPDVAAGVMEDAIGGERTCARCDGFLTVAKPTKDDPDAKEECPACRGKGTILYTPDSDIREMALRIGGLLEKGGGAKILIANSNQQGGGGSADPVSFDRLMAQLDGALYGEGRARQREATQPPAVDGEVVE